MDFQKDFNDLLQQKSQKFLFILASQSPRRKELLSQIIKEFKIIVPQILEEKNTNETAENFVKRLSLEKAQNVANQALQRQSIIIAADTIVTKNNHIFGKPKNQDDAISTLQKLSDSKHHVLTGVTLIHSSTQKILTFLDKTEIEFKCLSQDTIKEYCNTKEPYDKAGAYAIQGQARDFVKSIEGSLTNVIGLPMEKLQENLIKILS